MIYFDNAHGTTIAIDRESFEARIQELIGEKIGLLDELPPVIKSSIKALADMALTYAGQKPPKGVNKLEYLVSYVVHMALNAIDDKTLVVDFLRKETGIGMTKEEILKKSVEAFEEVKEHVEASN